MSAHLVSLYEVENLNELKAQYRLMEIYDEEGLENADRKGSLTSTHEEEEINT